MNKYTFKIGDRVKITQEKINELKRKKLLLSKEDEQNLTIKGKFINNNNILYTVKEYDVTYREENLKKINNKIRKVK